MREVEALHVDDAYNNALAAFVTRAGLGFHARRRRRVNGVARYDRLRCLEGFAELDESHSGVLCESRQVRDGDARFGNAASPGGFFDEIDGKASEVVV